MEELAQKTKMKEEVKSCSMRYVFFLYIHIFFSGVSVCDDEKFYIHTHKKYINIIPVFYYSEC